MKLFLLHEDTIGSIFRRFVQYLRKDPEFGPGVDPKNWGEVEELIEANGLPRIDFEAEWDRAVKLEDNDSQQALSIYKKLADKHPLSGLRSKSYFKRTKNKDFKLFLVCDIDNLKFLNSKLGHKGADSVLRKFGELLEQHLEKSINNQFGNISKTFHRSGDEYNVIINLQNVDPEPVIQAAIAQAQELLDRFSAIEFRSKEGKARASATIGIGFDEESIDIRVDKTKVGRRKLSIFGEMPHLIIGNDVKPYLQSQ